MTDTHRSDSDHTRSKATSAFFLAGFLLLFALLCAPWLERSRWEVPVPEGSHRADTQFVVWVLWWVSSALRNAPGSLFEAPINHPERNQLTGSDHFLSTQILFMPLEWMLGSPIQATTLTLWLACFPLSAWAMSRLLTRVGLSPWASLTGALLFVFSPRQLPVNIHGLQTPLLFLPLTASSILSLRAAPTARHAAGFAALLSIALFSSYYLAAMVLVTCVILMTAEYSCSIAERGRFLAYSLLALASSAAVFVWFSTPYFGRAEVRAALAPGVDPAALPRAIGQYFRQNPLMLFGGLLPIGLAALGLGAVRRASTRAIASAAAVIVLAGVFLASGGLALIADLPAPSAWRDVLLIPARFFRVSFRLVCLVSFGAAVLGAMGIDLLIRRWRYAGRVAAVGVVAYLLGTAGYSLRDTRMGPMLDSPVDSLDYTEVGRVTRENGSGPLLELPVFAAGANLQADHMVGSIWHKQPIITGHTGYLSPQHRTTTELAGALPDGTALRELISRTGLRWILVRPRPGLPRRYHHELIRGLTSSNLVLQRFVIGRWSLFQLRRLGGHARPAIDGEVKTGLRTS